MTEAFVPLVSASSKPRENGFAAFNLKPAPAKAADAPAANGTATLAPAAHSPEVCAKPTVTLQRNGEIVTSIRVQCGCGEVIELACVY